MVGGELVLTKLELVPTLKGNNMKRGQRNISAPAGRPGPTAAESRTLPSQASAAVRGSLLGSPPTNMQKPSHVQNPACAHTLVCYQGSHQDSDRKLALFGLPVGVL